MNTHIQLCRMMGNIHMPPFAHLQLTRPYESTQIARSAPRNFLPFASHTTSQVNTLSSHKVQTNPPAPAVEAKERQSHHRQCDGEPAKRAKRKSMLTQTSWDCPMLSVHLARHGSILTTSPRQKGGAASPVSRQ